MNHFKRYWPWGVVGTVVLIGVVLAQRQRPTSNPESSAEVTNTASVTSIVETGSSSQPTTVVAVNVVNAEAHGSVLLYGSGGSLYSLDLTHPSAQPDELTTLPVIPLEVRWSPDGRRAMALVSTDPVMWLTINLETQVKNQLNSYVIGPALANGRDRLLYTYVGNSGMNVSTADLDGQHWQSVLTPNRTILNWWWPGDGTVAIGAAETADPPQYVRLFVGQKTIETLASSYGYDLRLKLSPDETRMLIDTGTLDAPTMSMVPINGGALTTPTGRFSVHRSTWMDENTVASVGDDWNVTVLDFEKKTQTELGPWPDAAKPLDELVAVTAKDYYAVTNGSLVRLIR